MKQPTVLGVSLCLGIFTATISMAHSEKAINEAFPRGPIPLELIEATRELESTAGMNSLRGEAHAKQHRLLEQYLKAGLQRTCDESRAALLGLDEAILVARNSADVARMRTAPTHRPTMALVMPQRDVAARKVVLHFVLASQALRSPARRLRYDHRTLPNEECALATA